LNELGLNHSTAINIYYHQILTRKGIPFEVKIPNKTTLRAMEDLEKGKNVKKFDRAEELFEDLGI
jgi:DNA-damage-inducible protein J